MDRIELEHIEFYRKMTPEERIRLGRELTASCWRFFDLPDREAGDRKWAVWLGQHDASTESLLAGLARHAGRERERTVKP